MYDKVLKKDLIERFAIEFDLTNREATERVDFIFDTIIDELIAGKTVSIKDLGKFEIKHNAPRVAFNPATQKKINVPAKKSISFKVSSKLKEAVK